jgi:hypothetical protein
MTCVITNDGVSGTGFHPCQTNSLVLQTTYTAPAPRLVGIEPNPGPKSKARKGNGQQMKKQPKSKKTNVPRNQTSGGSTLSNVGSAVGGILGGGPGSALGKAAGGLLSRIIGWGDYAVQGNTLMTDSAPPSFLQNGDGVSICHREYLTDIVGSVGFALASYSINPGLVSTFPFLSQIALNFETYRLLGLIFEFRPTSGSAISSSSSALGTVIMATNYDPADSLFINKQQMESYEFSTSCVPFEKMIHPVECKPFSNVLDVQYIRTGSVPAGEDIQFYDRGLFQIATQGMQSAYTVGELWVSYHVQLLKPRILPSITSAPYAHYTEYPLASATAAAPFGTSGTVISTNSSLFVNLISPTKIELPYAGTYIISGAWTASGIAASPSASLGSNITQLYTLNDNASIYLTSYLAAGTAASYLSVVTVSTSLPNGTNNVTNQITFAGLTSMSAGKVDLFISQIPYSTTTV